MPKRVTIPILVSFSSLRRSPKELAANPTNETIKIMPAKFVYARKTGFRPSNNKLVRVKNSEKKKADRKMSRPDVTSTNVTSPLKAFEAQIKQAPF